MKNYINPANNDYYAWVNLTDEELEQPVPSQFLNSEGKKWKEYSSITKVDGNNFILAGYRDENGNRKDRISEEEFQVWLDYFEGRNVWNLEEGREYMKQFQTEEI